MPHRRLAIILLVLTLTAVACESGSGGDAKSKDAQQRGQAVTQQAQRQFEAAVPYPVDELKDSQERRNLRERLLRFNKPDKIGYVYLFSNAGSLIGFWTVKGKVSSAQSQMTTDNLINGVDCDGCSNVVNAPGDDGSYGENERAIFFFTTENVYVSLAETSNWVYMDAPLKLATAPIVVLEEGSKPSSVGGG